MKITYTYNSEKENILQSDYPKLILNSNTYSNFDIPHILKDIFKIDKPNTNNLDLKDRETIEKEISANILKKWLDLENKVFFELEKLFYVFINFYSYSKKIWIFSVFKSLINLIYSPKINANAYFKTKRSMREYCRLYNIENSYDCLEKIFSIFESIEKFLEEMREKVSSLIIENQIIASILKDKFFSYDVTVYSLYQIFRDCFTEKKDFEYLKENLNNFFKEKKQKYEKEVELLNFRDLDKEPNKFLSIDYLQNKNISEDVEYFFLKKLTF